MPDLTHIKVGDMVAFKKNLANYDYVRYQPQQQYEVAQVIKVTKTQAVASYAKDKTLRFRLSDGLVIGDNNFSWACNAMPEIIEYYEETKSRIERFSKARETLKSVVVSEFWRKKFSPNKDGFTIEQVEHLAKAWREVLEMGK